jgi:Omp85 superfamily domain
MGIEGSGPRDSETRHPTSLAGRLLRVLLVAGAWISFNAVCLAQQDQRLVQSGTQTVPQTAADSAQTSDQAEQSAAPAQPDTQSDQKKKRVPRGAFVVAPLPISSPALGSGIVPVLGYIFPFSMKDKISPPSVIGAAGLVTNNGSRGFAVGGQLYLKENTYRVTAGFGRGNVNYDIYGNSTALNLKLPLKQTGQAFFGEALRRVGWKFFLGPRFITGRSFLTIRPNRDINFPIPPNIGLNTNLTALGAQLTRDTSLNRFYPTGGTYFSFTSDFFSQALGSKYSFQSYKGTFSKYWGLSAKQVLAYNAFLCATGGSPPFYENCIYGTNNQLRGYTAGQYFTRYILATQAEYRLELPKRFGLVVFGGTGETIPGGQQLYGSQKFLPSGGGGLRFQLDKKHHVNLRADIAQGRGGHTFGLGIGEAF